MPVSPVAAAIAALEMERDNLSSRLQKVDAAIVSMRELFHLPKPAAKLNGHAAPVRRERSVKAQASNNGHRGFDVDAVRKALRSGPMPPRELAAALNMTPANLGYHAKKLQAQGVVTMSGTSAARRIALADGSAKEAP